MNKSVNVPVNYVTLAICETCCLRKLKNKKNRSK